jgi:cytochrome c oxidase subunit 2
MRRVKLLMMYLLRVLERAFLMTRDSGWATPALSLFVVVPVALALAANDPAWAGESGRPLPWQKGFQEAVTPVMREIDKFHDMLLIIIAAIATFVLALLVYTVVRFRESRNPVPARTSHHTLLEIAWTLVPIFILILVAVPSFRLLYYEEQIVEPEMTIKAIGHQWYWSYEYPDHGNFTFDSYMVADEDLEPGQPRLLATDNPVVVPVDTTVRVLVTASDVLHAWAVPAFGVKKDAVPGRLNETWFRAEREGMFYGQCSELCGSNHAFMPIAVRIVSKPAFAAWVQDAQKQFGGSGAGSVAVAKTR